MIMKVQMIYVLVTSICMIPQNGILSCGRPISKYVLPFDPCKHIQAYIANLGDKKKDI